jgi:acyl-CoA synthetase (AMP-forming)/AMP-acid ligase II
LGNENESTDNRAMLFKDFLKKSLKNKFDVVKFAKNAVKIREQGAFIFLSSGTTGLPKGVEISQANIISHIASNTDLMKFVKDRTDDIVLLVIAPFSHAMGFFGALFFELNSTKCKTVFLAKFEPTSYLECIQVNFHLFFITKTNMCSY